MRNSERKSTVGMLATAVAVFLVVLLGVAGSCDRDDNDVLAWMESECLECTAAEDLALCSDGMDNDEDGLVDCLDKDCAGVGCCALIGPEDNDVACKDGCDNDGDGYLDCGDHSCSKSADVKVCKSAVKEPEDNPAACSDGIDNDWNNYVDCNDFSCSTSTKVPFCEGNDTNCADGIDNDGNGFVDCNDFNCSQNKNVTVCKK
ncbi:MAG: hypothetical protein FJ109_14730 [Deltaproteobacteria bacterium]|nr:hypothetical protein [Deltaproteobacteria bacterium]